MMEKEVFIRIMRILIEMIDSLGIEKGRSSLDSVYLVSLGQKEFCEIGSILSGYSGYNCFFHTIFVKNISL